MPQVNRRLDRSHDPNAAPTTRDCGPTCMAMAALAFGRVPPSVNAADHSAIIIWCRQTMTGSTDDSNGTNYRQLETAANGLHLHPKRPRTGSVQAAIGKSFTDED